MVDLRKTIVAGLITLIALCIASFGCKTEDPGYRSESGSQRVDSPKLESSKKVPQQQASVDAAAVFSPILLSLREKTKVPLRLPAYLATEGETNALYAIIESASPSTYDIQLAFTQDCTGGNLCHYGVVSGRAIGAGEGPPKGKTVLLANGFTGYFVDATCGAVCSDSTLTWDVGGYRYTVGLKAEKLDTLRKVAESAIAK